MAPATTRSAALLFLIMQTGLASPSLGATDEAPVAAPAPFHIMIANPFVRQRVELALEGAVQRLTGAECQKVFTDFEDGAGRSLQSRLDVLRLTGAGFLTWLRFAEGDERSCAQTARQAAFTQPGSRVVHICSVVFAPRLARNSQAAEVLIIHELLHTLGLGENPPSSSEISDRVLVRCGLQNVQRKPI
jgi:hypothetical protein